MGIESVTHIFKKELVTEDDVDPYIVLGFAAIGLLFDCISLAAYRWCSNDESPELERDVEVESDRHEGGEDAGNADNGAASHSAESQDAEDTERPNINIMSALLHIGS